MNFKKIRKYLLSFIIPIVLLLITFALLGIYPFGNKDLLWFDTQAQYIDFLSYWQDVLKGQASIFYSFSKNLGGNMFGLFTYYLTSPINLIILLFSKVNLPSAFMVIILIKIGLCGLGFRYYIEHTKFVFGNIKYPNIINLIFSTLYAMLSYNIVYCMSHMWLDCVALLPLIFLGIEKIINEKKWGLYVASFTLAIIANYYIAFMIAIFTIPYYIYILLCNNKDKKLLTIIKENKMNMWLYIRMSLISVLISGIIIIPTIYSLVSSKGQLYTSSSLTLYMYFDYFTLFAKNTLGAFSMNELRVGAPNIYAGVMTLLLVIAYFFNNKIEKKEKIYTGIFLFIFFLCFYFNPINLSLHMMQSPMSFPFRYSFIFSFLTLIMAYKCINNMEEFNNKILIGIAVATIFVFMIVDHNGYEYLVNWKIFITMIFVVLYTMYLTKINSLKLLSHITLCILICVELVISSFLLMIWMPYGDRNIYINHLNRYTPVYEYVKGIDKGLYRIAFDNRKSLDDSMMYNFAGIEHYSSVGEKSTETFLSSIGFEGSPLVEYGSGTILDNSLLGVKYVLLNRTTDFYMNKKNINDVFVYENPYALPFGYVVSDKVLEYNNKYVFSTPFEYQNYIFGLITGKDQQYFNKVEYEVGEYSNLDIKDYSDYWLIGLSDSNNSGYIDFTIKTKNKPIYSYLSPEVRGGMVSFLVSNTEIPITDSNITYIGCSEDEITLRIVIYGEVSVRKDFLQYLDNEIAISELMKLSNNIIDITEHKDNYIKGNITTEKDELMFTTIPYDEGWEVYINGNKVEKIKVFDTFMAINLEKGENVIEFKYTSQGVFKGLFISIIGLVLLALEILLIYLNKSGLLEEHQDEQEKNEIKKEQKSGTNKSKSTKKIKSKH